MPDAQNSLVDYSIWWIGYLYQVLTFINESGFALTKGKYLKGLPN